MRGTTLWIEALCSSLLSPLFTLKGCLFLSPSRPTLTQSNLWVIELNTFFDQESFLDSNLSL